jgi:hypothetical protein
MRGKYSQERYRSALEAANLSLTELEGAPTAGSGGLACRNSTGLGRRGSTGLGRAGSTGLEVAAVEKEAQVGCCVLARGGGRGGVCDGWEH